jgi:MFS family permease
MFGDCLRTRFGDLRTMTVSLFAAIIGFFCLGFAPGFWPSVIAFAAVGCGLAVIFPCLYSLIGRLLPQHQTRAMAFASLIGGIPRITLPLVLGGIAAGQGVNAVFGTCVLVAMVAMVLIVFCYSRSGERLRLV